jgi:hypothetical protein
VSTVLIAFAVGIGTGILASILTTIAILRWPHERDPVRPRFYAVAGDRPVLHPDSSAHGATPHDWSGGIWNPPKGWRYIEN